MMKILYRYKILVFFIVLLSLFLNLYGINWGVPDKERINLVFEDVSLVKILSEEMQKSREEIYEKMEFWADPSQPMKEKTIEVEIKNEKLSISRKMIDAARSYLIRSYGDDEQHTLICMGNMNPSKLNFNPRFFIYGGGYLYPVAVGLKIASLFNYLDLNSDIKYYFLNPQQMGKMFTTGRIIGAIFCAIATYLIFLCGINLYGIRTGLIASLLFSVVPGTVIFSHHLKPYALTIFWMMLSFYWVTRILKEDKIKLPILAGLFAGFSAGTNLLSGFVLFFIPFAYFLRKLPQENISKKLKMILIAIAFFIVGFLLTNPYWLSSLKNVVNEYKTASGCWGFNPTVGNLYYYLRYTLSSVFGIPLLIFIICGIAYAFYKREKQDILILPLLLLMLIYFASSTTKFAHYGIFLAPFLIFLVGRFFAVGLSKTKRLKWITLIFLIFVSFYTFSYSFSYDKIFAQKNTRTIAGEWINNNISQGSKIGLLGLPSPWRTPPFSFFRYSLEITGFDKEIIRKKQPKYFILSEYQWQRSIGYKEMRKWFENYREIKRFEKIPNFFVFKFKRTENSPHDWCIPNPTILIFERK